MPFIARDPDLLELKFGGGKASLIGLPFLIVGLSIFTASVAMQLGLIDGDLPILVGLLFGLAFGGTGAGIVLGRRGVRIDRKLGEIVTWWGLPKPIRETKHPLAEARAVRIDREIRRSSKSSYVIYPVRIVVSDGSKLKIEEPRNDAKARQVGEDLAKFLQLPLADASSGTEITRQHDELDLTLKERFRKGRIETDIPEVPANLRSRIDFDGLSLQVEIPPSGFKGGQALIAVVVLGFALFAILGIFLPAVTMQEGDGLHAVLFLVFATVFLSIPLAISGLLFGRMFFRRESLKASNQGIEHSDGWPLRRTRSLPAEQIEEIFLGSSVGVMRSHSAVRIGQPDNAIIARGDHGALKIGAQLPPDEAAYILALLRAVLVS